MGPSVTGLGVGVVVVVVVVVEVEVVRAGVVLLTVVLGGNVNPGGSKSGEISATNLIPP